MNSFTLLPIKSNLNEKYINGSGKKTPKKTNHSQLNNTVLDLAVFEELLLL